MPAEYTQDRFPWVSRLAFVFFTFNTATAAYRSINDLPALSFLFIVCVIIVGIFWCLRKFERSDQKNKERLKVAVWILATLLATMFSYRVEEIIPWPVALVIWCLAFAGLRSGYPQLQRLLSLGSNMEPNEDPLSLQDDLESQLASATPAAAMEIESDCRRQAPRTPRCAICVDIHFRKKRLRAGPASEAGTPLKITKKGRPTPSNRKIIGSGATAGDGGPSILDNYLEIFAT